MHVQIFCVQKSTTLKVCKCISGMQFWVNKIFGGDLSLASNCFPCHINRKVVAKEKCTRIVNVEFYFFDKCVLIVLLQLQFNGIFRFVLDSVSNCNRAWITLIDNHVVVWNWSKNWEGNKKSPRINTYINNTLIESMLCFAVVWCFFFVNEFEIESLP